MTIKTRLKMKNRSHRYDINRPWPRHGHKHTKYKRADTHKTSKLSGDGGGCKAKMRYYRT